MCQFRHLVHLIKCSVHLTILKISSLPDLHVSNAWWRHQMEAFLALHAGPLCGEFTGHRWIPLPKPVTRSFDVSLGRLNKRLSKQSWGWWFETQLRSLWRHSDVLIWSRRLSSFMVTVPRSCDPGKRQCYIHAKQWTSCICPEGRLYGSLVLKPYKILYETHVITHPCPDLNVGLLKLDHST